MLFLIVRATLRSLVDNVDEDVTLETLNFGGVPFALNRIA
jgi:hypothetical protein